METSGSGIYENLKTVIWTAVVSVVSFQLLGPTIWGYMHKLSNMPYQTAYKIFIIGYTLLVPFLVLGWLIRDFNLIKKYLRPTDSPGANLACKIFLYGLIWLVGFLIAVSCLFLIYPDISWKRDFYYWPAYLFMILCLALLSGGIQLSFLRLSDARDYKRKAIENMPSPVAGRMEDLKIEYRYKKRKILQQLLSILALWIVATLFWGYYFCEKKNSLFRNKQAAVIGFPLQDVRDDVDAVRKKTFELVNGLQLEIQRDSALINTGITLADLGDSVILPGISRSLVRKMLMKEDSLLIQIRLIQDSQRIKVTLSDSTILAIRKDTGQWRSLLSEDTLSSVTISPEDSLAEIDKQLRRFTLRLNGFDSNWSAFQGPPGVECKAANRLLLEKDAFLSGHHLSEAIGDSIYAKIRYLTAVQRVTFRDSLFNYTRYQLYSLFAYLGGTEGKLDGLLKHQLGDLLRDVQATGMFLLLIVSLTLLSLYVFLKTTAVSIAWELETDQLTKRIQEYIHPDEQRKLENEIESVRLEKQLTETGSLTANGWTFLSLVIWLLIPFFKPVEDEKIDLNSPYKSLTFSGNGSEITWGGTTHIIRDTVITPAIRIDSVIIYSYPGSNPVDLRGKLEEIKKQVDKIESHIQPPTSP